MAILGNTITRVKLLAVTAEHAAEKGHFSTADVVCVVCVIKVAVCL